jgi:hypothetical protein
MEGGHSTCGVCKGKRPDGESNRSGDGFFYTDLGSALCYQNANEWLLWATSAKLGHSPFVPSYAVEVLSLMLLKS